MSSRHGLPYLTVALAIATTNPPSHFHPSRNSMCFSSSFSGARSLFHSPFIPTERMIGTRLSAIKITAAWVPLRPRSPRPWISRLPPYRVMGILAYDNYLWISIDDTMDEYLWMIVHEILSMDNHAWISAHRFFSSTSVHA